MSLLIVREEGVSYPGLHIESSPVLEYRFTPDFPSDGYSGWERASRDRITSIDVAAFCRSCEYRFRQQALNRFLARAVIRERPAAIVVCGLWGCTVDLLRIARMMGVPVVLVAAGWAQTASAYDDEVQAWLRDAMECCHYIAGDLEGFWEGSEAPDIDPGRVLGVDGLAQQLNELAESEPSSHPFSYSTYEFVMRDHPLLVNMQQGDTVHFSGLDKVLDLGCGAGIFLDCLRREGIRGVGVERDPVVASYGRGLGLDIVTDDGLQFLEATDEHFAGIYCSHFVEHLPVDIVDRLINLVFNLVKPGGVAVFVFPDPESIRSQLLGFWRDPEHVRFYHPELIASIATSAGFVLEWSSYDAQPHDVIPFPLQPPRMPLLPTLERPVLGEAESGWTSRLMAKLGWQSSSSVSAMQQQLLGWADSVSDAFLQQQTYLEELRDRSDTLWRVNQTWAWNDNVTLRFRKAEPADDPGNG